MTDYRCPACDGGFPLEDADDGCPWCGESMGGSADSGAPSLLESTIRQSFDAATTGASLADPAGTVGPDIDYPGRVDRTTEREVITNE